MLLLLFAGAGVRSLPHRAVGGGKGARDKKELERLERAIQRAWAKLNPEPEVTTVPEIAPPPLIELPAGPTVEEIEAAERKAEATLRSLLAEIARREAIARDEDDVEILLLLS